MSTASPELDIKIRDKRAWYKREAVVFVWLVALTVALLVIAYVVTGAFRHEESSLANDYFQRGQHALASAHPDAAIVDFRTALKFAPEKREYRLRLAQALAAANENREALAHFKDLWESEPGDGELNLELARLAVRSGNSADALRYFHGAIYGLWGQNPESNRRVAWLELIQFLLNERSNTQAQSELLALSASLPPESSANPEVAGLFLQAGDSGHALQLYRQALRTDPKNEEALTGAAQASYALGDYTGAVRYFKESSVRQPLPPVLELQAQMAELVLQLDPYRRGLSSKDRASRALANFSQAGDRLKACAAAKGEPLTVPTGQKLSLLQADFAQWNASQRQISLRALRENMGLMDNAMDLVDRIEQDTQAACGEPTARDMALLLLSRQRTGETK